MMKRFSILIGLTGLLLPGTLLALNVGSVYEHAKEQTERELNYLFSEFELEKYAEKFINEKDAVKKGNLPQIERKDVDLALKLKYQQLCNEKKGIEYPQCFELVKEIPEIIRRAEWWRTIARDLQFIAAGYEMGTDGYTGRIHKLSSGLPSIVSIWESGIDKMTNPVQKTRVRSGKLPDDDEMDPLYRRVEGELFNLIEGDSDKKGYDQFVAAVWRYRHGYMSLREGEECREDGDGTELELLNKRWCDLEYALEAIWEKVPKEFDPPLFPGEIGSFPPKTIYVEEMPIVIWMRADDIGIIWETPIEPVFPSTVSVGDELILGGTYPDPPPEPEPREGICSHPFASRGYLCRPVLSDMCPTAEDLEENKGKKKDKREKEAPVSIGLTECEQPAIGCDPEDEIITDDTPRLDNKLKVDENSCYNCVADLICGAGPDPTMGDLVAEKDGKIKLYIDPNTPNRDWDYLIIQEVAKAKKACEYIPDRIDEYNELFKSKEGCCDIEYEGQIYTCQALRQDGILDHFGISAETCARVIASTTCEGKGHGANACLARGDNIPSARGTWGAIVNKIRESADALGLSRSCSAAVNNIDPRALDLKTRIPHKLFPTRMTHSGPDVCRGGWRIPTNENELKKDTPKKDPNLKPYECGNCAVDFICKDNANWIGGLTYPKNKDGVIEIEISGKTPMPLKYVVIHELVHAQQFCDSPSMPGTSGMSQQECCAEEFEAYSISCKAAAEDGVFDETEFNIEECAAILSDTSCTANPKDRINRHPVVGNRRFPCTNRDPDDERLKKLSEAIFSGKEETCSQAVSWDTMDGRAKQQIESLKKSCNPKCEVEYENTIGNNLCYIGQCIEESIEAHRLIPGRMPLITGDEAYPWDSCAADDPQKASVLKVPPFTSPQIPSYKIQEIVEQMDTLICQANGLPRMSPPVLCSFDPRQRIGLPIQDALKMAQSLTGQEEAVASQAKDIQMTLENIGVRLGTTLYTDYITPAMKGLGDTIGAATTLVREIGETKFPTQMCPRYHTEGCDIFTSE